MGTILVFFPAIARRRFYVKFPFRRWWSVTAVLVLLAAFVAQGKVQAKDEKATPKAALTVTTIKPVREKWPLTVAASGSLTAWQEAVVAAETGGLRITHLYADVGDVVRRGQKLAQLDQDTVLVDVEQQQARVDLAKADLAEAKANAERARSAEGGSVMSAQLTTQYLIGQEKAQANLDAALALLKSQKIRLEKTNIVAVDAGVISSRNATLGSVVQTGAELFRMVRQNKVEWRAEVVADQASRIKPGQKVRVHLASGDTVEGSVRVTAPTFDPITRKSLVYVDLPAATSARAGMFARGEVMIGATEAMTLPQSAVVLRDGFSFVFVVGADQRVTQRKVVTGRRANNRVEISEGIDGNAVVVASGGAFLNDGDLVSVTHAETKQLPRENK